MTNKNDRLLERELRSSQVYQTLKSAGGLGGKLADGLHKAAQGIDSAITGQNPAGKWQQKNGAYNAQWTAQGQPRQTYSQASQPRQNYAQTRQTQGSQTQGPQTQGARRQGQQAQSSQYSYQYRYAQGAAPQQAARPQGAAPQGNRGQNPGPQAQPQVPMKLVHTGSPAKYYITGGAALVYALVGPLSQPSHFVIFILVLAAVFFLSGAVFKGKKKFVPIEPEKPKEEPKPQEEKEEKASSTGDPEVDKIIREGQEYLKKLRAADDAIPDETLSEDITRMEKASADIFRFIAEHPEKAPQIRKFMNYYLPTTLKLLNSYQRLSRQSARGETITSTMFNIAGMMHTVADAFEKQLDSLFGDEALDISADITVFETMLKSEGFVEEEKAEKK